MNTLSTFNTIPNSDSISEASYQGIVHSVTCSLATIAITKNTYTHLVVHLDVDECLSEVGIVSHWQEVLEKLEVSSPTVGAKSVGDKSSKLGVALEEPSTECQHCSQE